MVPCIISIVAGEIPCVLVVLEGQHAVVEAYLRTEGIIHPSGGEDISGSGFGLEPEHQRLVLLVGTREQVGVHLRLLIGIDME